MTELLFIINILKNSYLRLNILIFLQNALSDATTKETVNAKLASVCD